MGTSHNTSNKEAVANNTSSSIADLKLLLQRELELVKNVLKYLSKDDVNTMLEEDGYDLTMIEETDVLNPIDSYNLIKRTSRTWLKVKDALFKKENIDDVHSDIIEDILSKFPRWENSRIASALGLLNIQLYYELDPAEMMEGVLRDKLREKTYQAATRLRPEDLKLIASVAKSENNLKSQITWLRASSHLHKLYRKAVKVHNNLLAESARDLVKDSWEVFEHTVDESVPVMEDTSKLLQEGKNQCPPFQGKLLSNPFL